MRLGLRGLGALAVAVGMLAPGVLAAQEPDGKLRLMREPTSFTDVVDAFDDDDPFDVNVRVGYRHERSWGTIQREAVLGGFPSARPAAIASFEHTRNILDLQLDVGLYRDVALYVKLPVILSDDRRLSLDGNRAAVNESLAQGTSDGQPLFSPDFRSPTRSGIDQIAVGFAWAITNQARDPHLPTWVVMAEGLFNVGDVMRACSADFDDPGSATRCNGGNNPGISRGTAGIQAEMRGSRRYRFVEPYMGLLFKMEWALAASDSFTGGAGNLSGFMNPRPPVEGEITFGMAFVPWERVDRFQRLTIDLRGSARYISEGHNYSPLFDALGTSASPDLRTPNTEIPTGGGREVHFMGLTDVQAHGRYGGRIMFDIRAAQYVQFVLGAGLFYTTPHFLTNTDACNPNVSTEDMFGEGRRGTCVQGISDPHYRPVIDDPGYRFQLNGLWSMDFMASAIARF
jgi:hypothetical protein